MPSYAERKGGIMAGDKSKPLFKRLMFIDQEIRGGMFPSCAKMAAKWEVSAKTIQRDVDYLKYEMKAPLEYDKSKHGLYYSDKTWFLPAVMLNEGDILALLIGTQALEMYKGTPVAGELKSIYSRLTQLLPDKVSMAPELMFTRFSFHGTPTRPISDDIWKTLIRGVINQRVTWIDYASPQSDKPKEHTIHPLHLANIEGDWYILAFEPRWNDIVQFAVSRIKKAELKEVGFNTPKGFNADRMLKDRFGKFVHTAGGDKIEIRLLFRPDVATTIAERTWHPKQKLTRRKDGSLELTFPVLGIQDVVPWILSMGSSVRILGPALLRQAIRSELKAMSKVTQ